MTLNDQDARALTYLACRIRKETYGAGPWDEHGTRAVLSKLIGRNLALSIEQVARHAADPKAKTPAAILRPFLPESPHVPGVRQPPKRPQECRTHPGSYADNCGGCAADRLVAKHADPEPNLPPLKDPIAAARAAVAAVKVCRHGSPSKCSTCERAKEDA